MALDTNKTLGKTKKLLGNRKVLLGTSALVVCVLLIGLCSFVPFLIDPSRWQTNEFLTDQLISIAIVLSSMVSAIFIGQASNASNDDSQLAKARRKFMETVEPVKSDINRFTQWVKKVLQPNDTLAMKKRKLNSLGLEDETLLELEYAEIKALLETPQKYNGRFYKGLSKAQIKGIIAIKNGKNIQFVEPNYYLTCNKIIDTRTISEQSTSEQSKKSAYLLRSVIGKVIVTVITAMIFASLIADSKEIGAAEAWTKFLSRLWSMFSSIFMGYLTGTQINDIDASYIEIRTEVHLQYLQDKDFVAISQQDEAKQAYIERVKKEQITQISQLQEQTAENAVIIVNEDSKEE